jgi:sugar lactone lactonase YvrE
MGIADSICEQVAKVEGGFLLGLAHDAAGNTYACDDRNACVHRITPQGVVSTYCSGNAEQRMRVPNYPVFDDAGNLFVSDSGEWGKKNSWIWKIAPGGAAVIWDKSACGFTNGMCLSADGKALYVVESSPPLISKVAIRPDGTAGERRCWSGRRAKCRTASPSMRRATSTSGRGSSSGRGWLSELRKLPLPLREPPGAPAFAAVVRHLADLPRASLDGLV